MIRTAIRALWALALVAPGGCAAEEPGRHHFLSVAMGGPEDELVQVLADDGLRCRPGMSSLGSVCLYIEGTHADLFRARERVLEGVTSRGWKVAWPAGYVILPHDPRYERLSPGRGESNDAVPEEVRVATVDHRRASTLQAIRPLRREAIPFRVWLGESEDIVAVNGTLAARASRLMLDDPRDGVKVYPLAPR